MLASSLVAPDANFFFKILERPGFWRFQVSPSKAAA